MNKEEIIKQITEMNDIAVFKKKIIGANPDMKKLMISIRKKQENIDTILIEFISGEDYYLIL
jgi:hypothetical protein